LAAANVRLNEEWRLKIRIFALAKELGLDSKELIQACNDAGLNVKSSPLASISPDERDMVLGFMKNRHSSPTAVAERASEANILSREDVADRMGKVKPIRTMGTMPAGPLGGLRRGRPGRPEDVQDEPQAEQAPVEEEVVETPTVESEPAVAEAASTVTAPVAESPPVPAAPAAEQVASPAPSTPTPEDAAQSPASPPAADAGGDKPKVAPMTRSDYVAPGGRPGFSGMREMRARGSVRDPAQRTGRGDEGGGGGAAPPPIQRGDRSEPDRGKRGPALPSIATPSFKPTAPNKRSEGPVQKPDLSLTAEMLKKRSPLAEIIKKHKDIALKKPMGEGGDEDDGRKGARPGQVGLQETRDERRRRRAKTRGGDDESTATIVRSPKRHRKGSSSFQFRTEAVVSLPATIRSFSEELGRPAKDIIGVLFRSGRMATINDSLDEPTLLEIGLELGVDLKIHRQETVEDIIQQQLSQPDEELGELLPRPPIITVLGHVDHGKTTLVDHIRRANVAAGEAGGITQHIAAYQVERNGHKLTFVDTPGHAAFGEMRARGANVTDIVVLVVAADDGVMPQTVECISHARAAGAPIVVAMNKVDLPGANQQKVLTDLSNQNLLPSEWGGDTEVVRVSALQGTGIDDLLETLLVTAELNELKAPANAPADGVCLEAFRDEGRGPVAWLIVRRGTLRVGDLMLCGPSFGFIRAMYNDRDEPITEAPPSTPVRVSGLNEVPNAGDKFLVLADDDIDIAREVAERCKTQGRAELLSRRSGLRSLEDFLSRKDGSVKDLPLIIKADTPGSIEALRHEIGKLQHNEVRTKIIHEAVGGVNESDVYLASSAGAIIIAFHVVAEDRAASLAEQEGVEIRRYNIIYNVTDDIRSALEGLLKPERVEVSTGRALVLRTFPISRVGTIAGCRVLNGTIERSNRVHVIRDQKILNHYGIASLKREKDDVREVRDGLECGIRLEGFNDIKEGDLLEAFKIEERKRSFDS
jgi:translation initiation factor IF-2